MINHLLGETTFDSLSALLSELEVYDPGFKTIHSVEEAYFDQKMTILYYVLFTEEKQKVHSRLDRIISSNSFGMSKESALHFIETQIESLKEYMLERAERQASYHVREGIFLADYINGVVESLRTEQDIGRIQKVLNQMELASSNFLENQ